MRNFLQLLGTHIKMTYDFTGKDKTDIVYAFLSLFHIVGINWHLDFICNFCWFMLIRFPLNLLDP